MKNKVITLVITFTILFFGISAFSFGQLIPNAPFKAETMKAPDFTLKDLKGKTFRLTKNPGKPVLLFFGATWCPACRTEIPAMKNIYKTYTPMGLEILYINIGESSKRVGRFVQTNSLPYRVLLDENEDVADLYNIVGVPTFILIDKEGLIINIGHRSADLPLTKLFPEK
ncbi:MAG: TlpA family protein disulfide reductase [Syntrophaceae bacterium]|nr:TlpA family protein disulfide reductase [Syntrophaceae bacterium]